MRRTTIWTRIRWSSGLFQTRNIQGSEQSGRGEYERDTQVGKVASRSFGWRARRRLAGCLVCPRPAYPAPNASSAAAGSPAACAAIASAAGASAAAAAGAAVQFSSAAISISSAAAIPGPVDSSAVPVLSSAQSGTTCSAAVSSAADGRALCSAAGAAVCSAAGPRSRAAALPGRSAGDCSPRVPRTTVPGSEYAAAHGAGLPRAQEFSSRPPGFVAE